MNGGADLKHKLLQLRIVGVVPTLCLYSVVLAGGNVLAQGHKQVEEGNRLFTEQKYDEANNKYRDALIAQPESDIVHFNIGDVQYKKRNFEEAMTSYEKALSSEDILLQAQSYYNIGNTLYKMGKLPESILSYKKALELNPADEDAKYNLEYVRAKLKDNQQQNEQDQQNNQQQQNEEQQQNEKGQVDENQQQQKEQQDEHQEQGEQQKNEERQQNEQKPGEEGEQEQQEEQQTKEISKEDAERILDALQNEEQDLLKNKKKRKIQAAFRGKDW